MRAALMHGYGQPLVIEDVGMPEPGAGEVVVQVEGAGLCHSDLHLWSGELPMLPSFPWVLGHENAGRVAALGPGATGFEVGEQVAVFGGWGCGACRFCLGGDEQVCDPTRWGGIGRQGGWAEYLLVPSTRHLVRLGDLDPVAAAPLTDAGLTAYRAVRRAAPRLTPVTTAVTIGVGGLGQYGVQLLRELTGAKVIAVDTAAAKRSLAEDLGADVALDPSTDGIADEIRGQSAPGGVAAVIDYVGSDATLQLAAQVVGTQGMVVVVGLAGGTLPWSFLGVAFEAVVTSSAWGNRNELEDVIALAAAGRLRSLVERVPLDGVNDAIGRLQQGAVEGRVVLTP